MLNIKDKIRAATNFLNGIGITIIILIYFTNSTEKSQPEKNYSYQSPTEINFCGESVPLNDLLVNEAFDRELIINTYWHSRTIQVLKRANKYFPIIESILDSLRIPEDLKYLAVIESDLLNIESPAGAKGFWQFLEKTGQEFGLEINDDIDERLHLEKSTIAACKYLHKSHEELGSWTLAAASYNMGLKGIKTEINLQSNNDYYKLNLNTETARYVYRILATKFIFENATSIGFEWEGMVKYHLPTFKTYLLSENIIDLKKYCYENNFSYKELKNYNPWLRSNKFIGKEGKTYLLKLPE